MAAGSVMSTLHNAYILQQATPLACANDLQLPGRWGTIEAMVELIT